MLLVRLGGLTRSPTFDQHRNTVKICLSFFEGHETGSTDFWGGWDPQFSKPQHCSHVPWKHWGISFQMSYWEGRWRQYCPIGGRVFCFWAKYLRFWGFEQELWLLKVGRLWNFEFVTKIKRRCKNYTRSILFWVLGSETNISWRQPYWLLVLFVSGIKANNDSLNYLNHYGGQTLWHNCATNLHFWISIPYQPGMVPVTKDQ